MIHSLGIEACSRIRVMSSLLFWRSLSGTLATSFAGICEVIITDISGLTTVNRLHPIDHASCDGSFSHGSRHTGAISNYFCRTLDRS
jgi:hypothetical protein